MKVAVGSKNPLKIRAVKAVLEKIWPDAEVVSLEVDHGAKDQPDCESHALDGALSRAQLSLQEANADFGLGMESYFEDCPEGMRLGNCVIAVDKNGKKGYGSAGWLMVPEHIAKELRAGKELGPVMDKYKGEDDTKKKYGTVGVLTKHLIERQQTYESSVTYALAPFFNKEVYEDQT